MRTGSSAGISRKFEERATFGALLSWRTWITLAIVGAAIAAICFATQEAQAPVPDSGGAKTATAAFGPGAWVNPSSGTGIEPSASSGPPLAPAVDASGNLIVDTVLRDDIEYFLLEPTDSDSMAALRSYMSMHLPPAASKEAVLLAERYGIYMQRHDYQIAAQNFSLDGNAKWTPDTNRIATWLQQRTRLRHEVLGDAVTQAWYQNDDAQLQQALDELQQRGAENMPYAGQARESAVPVSIENGVPPVPHWRDPVDAVQHEQYLNGLLRNATHSFDTRAIERRRFVDRYNAYASGIDQIAANLAPDSTERATQVSALRNRFFVTETEKQLAQERWAATHPPR